jgi:hypothetical protein
MDSSGEQTQKDTQTNMSNSYSDRKPLIQEVPQKFQMEFAAYLASRRSDWGTAEAWLARRMANTGNAIKMQTLSPGTTRHDPQPTPKTEKSFQPVAPAVPVTTTDLGQRFIGGTIPKGTEPMSDEARHEGTGELVTKSATTRSDY